MEQNKRLGPTIAEVEGQWTMPNLVEQTSGLGPVEAFRKFMAYAERALHHDYERGLNKALNWDAISAGEIRRIVPKKVEGSPSGDQSYLHTPVEVEERITVAVNTALRQRIAPLLPAIELYLSRRRNDPATVNRLAWMAEQIEAIPGASDGRALWRSREQPNGFLRDRKFEPMAWKELHDGLLALMDMETVNPGSTSASRPLHRLTWEGSTIEFVTIFKKLMERGYLDPPTTGGKQGDGNTAEYIRRLQQVFVVCKDDRTEFSTEGLADRWRGKPMAKEREAKFEIPEATRKRLRT